MIPTPEEPPTAGPAPATAGVPPIPELVALRARFMADFIGGRIGRHHNTFQHRERVLRQLTAQAHVRSH
jgi:hypothetical protein